MMVQSFASHRSFTDLCMRKLFTKCRMKKYNIQDVKTQYEKFKTEIKAPQHKYQIHK